MLSFQDQYAVVENTLGSNCSTILLSVHNAVYILHITYPDETHRALKDASLHCSDRFCQIMQNQESIIRKKLEQCQTIDDFAKEVLVLIERITGNEKRSFISQDIIPLSYYKTLLHDIEECGWHLIDSISPSLQQITVSLPDPSKRSHDIMIQFPTTYPEGMPVCKFATPKEVSFQWKEFNPLSTILQKVQAVLTELNDIWTVLEDIDHHCIVIDPTKPTFHHTYRRIYLENQCSLLYTVNIDHPFAIGEWKLMGPTSQIEAFEQRMNQHLHLWDRNAYPRQNLEKLLDFSFQEPSEKNAAEYEIECAICYSYQLEYHGVTLLPDRSCPNEKISFCGS